MRQNRLACCAGHESTTMKRTVASEVGGSETPMALWLSETPPGGGGCVLPCTMRRQFADVLNLESFFLRPHSHYASANWVR